VQLLAVAPPLALQLVDGTALFGCSRGDLLEITVTGEATNVCARHHVSK
jgi:hypothetical protein